MFEIPKAILLVISSLGIALATFVGDLTGKAETGRENVVVEQTIPVAPVPDPVLIENPQPEMDVTISPPIQFRLIEDSVQFESCPSPKSCSRTRHVEWTRPTIFPLFQRSTVHVTRDRYTKRFGLLRSFWNRGRYNNCYGNWSHSCYNGCVNR